MSNKNVSGFRVVRQNALANSTLYGGRYAQPDEAEAFAAYLRDVYASTGDEAAALELARLQRAKLYKACVKVLDVKRSEVGNLFKLAANFADLAVSSELSPMSTDYEIPSGYTKSGQPYVVEF